MHLDPSLTRRAYDREAVIETAHRLFWAIDAKRWDGLAPLCAAEVGLDWPGLVGLTPGPVPVAAFAEAVVRRLGATTTLHQCTNPLVTVEGDRAEARFLVTARHRRPTMRGGDTATVFSDHSQELRREGDTGWKVTAIQHLPLSTEGNPGILQLENPAPPSPGRPRSLLPPEDSPRSDAERLRLLEDRAAIHDVMMRFGRGLDAKDWRLYRSCFADRVTIDFSETTGRPAREVDTDAFVEFASLRQRSHRAFHQYSNLQVRVRGDEARCLLYLVARHRVADTQGDPWNVFVGWYDNEFVRRPDGWKVKVLRHPLQWVEGNAMIKDAPDPAVVELARRLFGQEEAS